MVNHERLTAFQDSLKQGMTIDEALTKYNLTLKQAFTALQYTKPNTKTKKRRQTSPERNIIKHENTYLIRKTINHHTKYYGRYNTLADARRVKNELISLNWNADIDEVCQKLGIQRRMNGDRSTRTKM